MKQLFTLFLVLNFAIPSLAQNTEPSANRSATDYLMKSKNQKTAAWILLGGGGLMTLIGTIVAASEATDALVDIFDPGATVNKNAGEGGAILAVVGTLAMAGSIPLFIASGKNRRKAAAAVSFKMENSTIIDQWAISARQYPAIAIRLSL